jgi:DNA-directed RNA polymerase II subunit RPB2
MQVRAVLQEIVDENAEILVVPENQYAPGEGAQTESKEYEVRFGQIYLSKPTITEADGETSILFPKESRLRNLTCAALLIRGHQLRSFA